MNNNLTTTNQNSKIALAKSKGLLDITNKILSKNKDTWIENLFQWADQNDIPNHTWVKDEDFNEGGYHIGIPRDTTKLLSMEILRLHDLKIDLLADEIFNLIQLKELSIKNCALKNLSNKISKLTNLENLYLAKNNLYQLPSELQHLSKLKKNTFTYK